MKISKLFHWLYAILMLLPVVVFIPTAFYYGFNEHAVAQEKTELVPVYYETNEVDSINDLVLGNCYMYNDNLPELNLPNSVYFMSIAISDNFSTILNDFNSVTSLTLLYDTNNLIQLRATRSPSNTTFTNVTNIYFNFVPVNILDTTITNNILSTFSISETPLIKEYQPLVTNMSITDSMSYAWDSVWQNDLFSWSYDSFLTQPFLYITNLFNVPANNTLVYCLSYWLNISIIWLVFDVIMYVPLLVHRWLDKGIVE